MKSRVFVSSTCYDLIDLRAEIEKELKDMGLIPVLSDSATSDFEVSGKSNSIEECLINVRECDYYLIVLSQRYGPSLKKAGYADVSATHLEYLEAKKLKKPIYMYVRSLLEAEQHLYNRSKKNDEVLKFVQKKDCVQLFKLYEDHKRLSAKSKESNWINVFKDCVELKALVRRDFKTASGAALLKNIIKTGDIPVLTISTISASLAPNSRILTIAFDIVNIGKSTAINPIVTMNSLTIVDGFEYSRSLDSTTRRLNSFVQGGHSRYDAQIPLEDASFSRYIFHCIVEYNIIQGYRVSDTTRIIINMPSTKSDVMYMGKQFVHEKGYEISVKNQKSIL